MIIGIFGACRREELAKLMLDHIEHNDLYIKLVIPFSKTKIMREFVITEGNVTGVNCLSIFRGYAKLRPLNATHRRFFVFHGKGKCTSQPVGINSFGSIPKKIATKLGLNNPEGYSGHCFRRSSATILVDGGADMQMLKRHGGYGRRLR